MTEFNPYPLLLRELPAEAIGCRHEAKVFELRGMETMRQRLNVVGDVRKALAGVMDVIADVHRRFGQMLVPLLQFDCQERTPWVYLVVEFPRNPRTLLFVGLN